MDSLMNALGFYRVETKGNDMNYNDYKAAVERLRRVASESASGVYADVFVDSDKLAIYDAEHDREPTTVEWLREVGFIDNPDVGELVLGRLSVDYLTRHKHFPVYLDNRVMMFKDPTRGDVLTALRSFKKEGAA